MVARCFVAARAGRVAEIIHPANTTARRLRQLVDRFVAIYPDHVPPTSILREFIGGSGFEY